MQSKSSFLRPCRLFIAILLFCTLLCLQITAEAPSDAILPFTEDVGEQYIDRMIFIGESTTSHLKSRGVLSEGKATERVWSKNDNTRTLSSRTLSEPINIPERLCGMTLSEAFRAEKPEYAVLSFGLNGLSEFVKAPDRFADNYNRLIDAILEASPGTRIILQSIYPVTCARDGEENPFPDIDAANRDILLLNRTIEELAAERPERVRFCDTASVLRTDTGALKDIYSNGDGIHLTEQAYREILYYLRTHAWVGNQDIERKTDR